jgi:hypothetical protein
MNELAVDLAKLEQMLPKFTFEKPKVKEAGKTEKPVPKEEEIDLLERELAEVEAKLKML